MTLIAKAEVADAGVVENTNVDPPSDVMGIIEAEAVEDTEKSETTPVVEPEAPETLMIHPIALPERCGFPKLQSILEAIVGIP